MLFFSLLSTGFLVGCANDAPPTTSSVATSDFPILTLSYGGVEVSSLANTLTINESDRQFFLTATLSKPSPDPVYFLFQYNAINTNATILKDFLIPEPEENRDSRQPANSLEVVFPPNETTVSFTYITLTSDTLYEKDEQISFWVRPLSNISINLPSHPFTGLPYVQLALEESSLPPQISITQVKLGNNDFKSAASEITAYESQTIELLVSSLLSKSITDTTIAFELISDLDAIEDVDYGFPYAENKLTPTDTISEFTFKAEAETFSFIIPLYSAPVKQDPKRLIFRIISVDGDASIGNLGTITINIIDDGNNGFDLNDTGITTCYDNQKNEIATCVHPDYLNEDGASDTPMQFSKYLSVNEAPTGTPPLIDQTSWDCVYDQTTGLLWEVVTNPNSNIKATYTWYDENPTSNGGSSGIQIENEGSTVNIVGSTKVHVDALNSQNHCGIGDNLLNETGKWRMPKLYELLSIMDFGTPESSPFFIDNEIFKIPGNLVGDFYFWTATPSALDSDLAWCVAFKKATRDTTKLCAKSTDKPVIMVSTVEIIPQ